MVQAWHKVARNTDLMNAFLKERHLDKYDFQRDHKPFVQFIKRGDDVLAPFNGGLEGIWKPVFEH